MTLHQTIHRAGEAANNPSPESVGFDLFRLDCAVDALRGQPLSQSDREELARIFQNLNDLMETPNGHAH